MSDHERLADDVQTELLRTRKELTQIIRGAAYHSIKAIAEGGDTGPLADLAYAFACLEGAHRGVLPGTPPPRKSSASAETPPKPPTSTKGSSYSSIGDTTRTNR